MGALPHGAGGMAAVRGAEAAVRAAAHCVAAGDDVADEASHVEVAAVNGPEGVVIAGGAAALERAVAACAERGLHATRLRVRTGFHSRCVAPALDAIEAAAREAHEIADDDEPPPRCAAPLEQRVLVLRLPHDRDAVALAKERVWHARARTSERERAGGRASDRRTTNETGGRRARQVVSQATEAEEGGATLRPAVDGDEEILKLRINTD